ncbi:patatin-like phospholipase family protein [Rhizobium oryzicola]|uniref:Patatin-like phospholipase family protein n=1 Tax=Rhizobium oryzicola TaxID=1232668 RepID=A0ABT8T2F5_9HYPH|nr:patatin-like phospholipase family protein [Rhizobium oryzicola]MDO1584846.1 patatin-like phospholipase family protein [Rhizobium oryzicola]
MKTRGTSFATNRPPFECIALVLQGGGALGSYQAGIYEAMAEAGLPLDWVAGISIGAVNAALIAGNPPEKRVEKLHAFWNTITTNPLLDWVTTNELFAPKGELARRVHNAIGANYALLAGAADFFTPRFPAPFFHAHGSHEATSFYDTAQLRSTLERLVDFDRINHGETRFSVGAVNVRTGNFTYFDNTRELIRPEHVMASGALPPGFGAVEIDGEHYWDGGLISNTPLQWVVDTAGMRQDTLAFQVDLWSARGDLPGNIFEVSTRQKEIQYSSRTRSETDHFKRLQRIRGALAHLLENLPPELQNSEDFDLLKQVADQKVYSVVHLIYRTQKHEGHSKDYEFSRLTMLDHWKSGYQDAKRTLENPAIYARPQNREGVLAFDLLKEDD